MLRNGYPSVFLAAFAEGYGPAWTEELTIDDPDGNRLELVADDAPIAGRLIDLEGRPLPDVTVHVVQIDATPTEDLSPWLSETQSNPNDGLPSHSRMFTRWLPDSLSMLIPPVKTGPDGRFQLRGAGRERIVSLLIQGARVQTRVVQVMTRVGSSKSMPVPRPQPGQMAEHRYLDLRDWVRAYCRHPGGMSRATWSMPPRASRFREWSSAPEMTHYRAFENPYPLIRWRSDMAIRVATDGAGITVWAACPWAIRSSWVRSSATECLIDPCPRNYPTRRASAPPGSTSNSCAEFRCRERSRTGRPASPSRPSSNTFPRSRIRT